MSRDYKKTKAYRVLKQSLLDQLKENGNEKDFFIDLVEDYMRLWVIKNQLNDDIEERGVVTTYKNGANQFGTKRNDSIADLLKVNAQMLKILTQLEIKAIPTEGIKDDDDEL